MKQLSLKLKVFIIATLVVLIVGLSLFGFLGLNQTPNNRNNPSLTVRVDQDSLGSGSIMQSSTESFLNAKGIKIINYATEEFDGKTAITYYLKDSSSLKVIQDNIDLLETGIKDAILAQTSQDIDVTVSAQESVVSLPKQSAWVILAGGIMVVAIFIYLLIIERASVAVSAILTSALSMVLFLALMGICRIPAYPFFGACLLMTGVLSMILSTGLLSRFKEELKSTANDKLDYYGLADKVSKKGQLRLFVIGGIVLVAAILVFAISTTYVKFLGLQILLADICAVFTTYAFSCKLCALLKSKKKDRKKKAILTDNTEDAELN